MIIVDNNHTKKTSSRSLLVQASSGQSLEVDEKKYKIEEIQYTMLLNPDEFGQFVHYMNIVEIKEISKKIYMSYNNVDKIINMSTSNRLWGVCTNPKDAKEGSRTMYNRSKIDIANSENHTARFFDKPLRYKNLTVELRNYREIVDEA